MLEDDNIRFLMLVHPTWPPCLCHSRYPIAVRKTFLHLSGQAIATQKQIWSYTANAQCQNEQGTGSTSKRSQRTLGSFGGTCIWRPSGFLFPEIRNLDAFLSTAISFKLFASAYHVPPPSFSENTSKQHRSIHRTCGFKPKCACSVQLIHFKVYINITYKYEGSEEWDGAEHEGENEAGEQSVTKELDGLEGTGHVGTTKVVEQRIAKHEDTSGSVANKQTNKQTNNNKKERNSSLNFFVI